MDRALRLRALYLANVGRAVQSGTSVEQLGAIKSLAADIALWKRMLQGEGTLISKMVATAYLHADLLLLADMIEDREVPLDQVQSGAATVLVQWPTDAWRIGKVFGTELRRFSAVLTELSADRDSGLSLTRVFYKPNATRNLQARILERLASVADADPAHYSQNARSYLDWYDQLPNKRFPALLYNPVGKALVSMGDASFLNYPLRTFDVAAFQRLVVLAYQLRAQNVSPAQIPAFMVTHPEFSTHPVDQTPFAWDATKGEIRVVQHAQSLPGRRFSIVVIPRT